MGFEDLKKLVVDLEKKSGLPSQELALYFLRWGERNEEVIMADVREIEETLHEIGDYITVPEAAAVTGVTQVTIRTWSDKYGIGRKIGGRFYIDPEKLSLLLKGDLKKKRI